MLLALFLFITMCSTCVDRNSDYQIQPKKLDGDTKVQMAPQKIINEEQQIRDIANQVLRALKHNDLRQLSGYVHPKIGVRFSPYTYIDSTVHRTIQANKFIEASRDTTRLHWGYYDGSGEPIMLTFTEYLKKFVYDADFLEAKQIGYQRSIARGNTKNNSFDLYRDARIIEFHFPGFDERYEGMDWKSLKLVFKQLQGRWYLIGIIHDQWTI